MFVSKPIPIGAVAGATVWLHPVGLVIALLLAIPCAIRDPLAAVVLSAVLFLSILAHEAGHALVARRFGLRVDALHHMGIAGLCVFEDPGARTDARCAVAAAGPCVNFMIAGLLLPVAMAMESLRFSGSIVGAAVTINAMLGIGNLLPIIPLDGSQILYALVWSRWSESTAALVTGAVGMVLAVPALVLALIISVVGFPVGLLAYPSVNRNVFRRARDARRRGRGEGGGTPTPPSRPSPPSPAEADRLMAAILAEQSRRNAERRAKASTTDTSGCR